MRESELTDGVNNRRSRWRIPRRLLRLALCAYLGVAIVVYAIQDRLVFPGASTQGTATAIIRESSAYELLHLKTADGTPIVAIFGGPLTTSDVSSHVSADAPTVLFFYGNGMSLADCFSEFRFFRNHGCNVLIPEYAGYGMSDGKASEQAFYDTADAAYAYLLSRPDVDAHRIIPAGWSIGGAVAIDLAARKKVAGLMTFAAFSSMVDMGRLTLPWLPTSLFLRSRFENERKIGQVTAPILLVHGKQDNFVPFVMEQRLAAAAGKSPGRSVRVLSYDANHVNIFEAGGKVLDDGVCDFLNGLSTSAR